MYDHCISLHVITRPMVFHRVTIKKSPQSLTCAAPCTALRCFTGLPNSRDLPSWWRSSIGMTTCPSEWNRKDVPNHQPSKHGGFSRLQKKIIHRRHMILIWWKQLLLYCWSQACRHLLFRGMHLDIMTTYIFKKYHVDCSCGSISSQLSFKRVGAATPGQRNTRQINIQIYTYTQEIRLVLLSGNLV